MSNNPDTLKLQIPSKIVKLDADGVPFDTTVDGTIEVGIRNDRLMVDATVRANLAGLQAVVPQLVQKQSNKSDDCDEVVDVHTVSLRHGGGSSAEAFVGVHFEKWHCATFGVPGLDGWKPVLKQVTVKNKVFEQNGSLTLGLEPVISDGGTSLNLKPTIRKVDCRRLPG